MIYVDDSNEPYDKIITCAMVADTSDELMNVARRIGVPSFWIDNANTPFEHFDISLDQKRKAICEGAIEISQKDMAIMCWKRRNQYA